MLSSRTCNSSNVTTKTSFRPFRYCSKARRLFSSIGVRPNHDGRNRMSVNALYFKKGYRALDVGRARAHALIDQVSAQEPIDWLCVVFDITRSCYYAHRLRRRTPDVERLRLRSRVNELFTQSRSAAGSRSIVSMMQKEGDQIGRFKVRGLMRELALVSKQPGSHAYKQATVERPDIPNILNREF